MLVEKITFSGIDETVNIDYLFSLINKYPSIEFGVLYGGSKKRYPSLNYINTLCATIPKKHLSIHLCGEIARNLILGTFLTKEQITMVSRFNRLQINFDINTISKEINLIDLRYSLNNLPVKEIIIQGKGLNYLLAQYLNDYINVSILAKDIEDNKIRFPYNYIKTGYTGGFSLKNISKKIKELKELLPTYYNTWIDMESSIDTFDLAKVFLLCK